MDSVLLSVLRFAGPAVLLISAWAVWVRRSTLRSRLDSSATMCTALFGLGAALDSPWPQIAAASYPPTGKYYVLTMIGHLFYIIGGALGVRSIYLRLLPDEAFDRAMRKWLAPAIIGIAAIMVGAFALSPVISRDPSVHLYLVRPDGWLTVYYLVLFGTAILLGVICGYGVYRLRRDPRAVLLNVILAALVLAVVSGGVVLGLGAITGRIETVRLVGWLLNYVAFAAAAVGSALQWRHRVRMPSPWPASER